MSYLDNSNAYLEYVEGLGYRDNWNEVRKNIESLIDDQLTPELALVAKSKLERNYILTLIEVELVDGYVPNPLPNEIWSIRLDSEVDVDGEGTLEDFSSYRYVATLDVTSI